MPTTSARQDSRRPARRRQGQASAADLCTSAMRPPLPSGLVRLRSSFHAAADGQSDQREVTAERQLASEEEASERFCVGQALEGRVHEACVA
eukprot:352209-Hanusia_phi.AAC.10